MKWLNLLTEKPTTMLTDIESVTSDPRIFAGRKYKGGTLYQLFALAEGMKLPLYANVYGGEEQAKKSFDLMVEACNKHETQ